MGTVIITDDTTKTPITMIGFYAGVCWGLIHLVKKKIISVG